MVELNCVNLGSRLDIIFSISFSASFWPFWAVAGLIWSFWPSSAPEITFQAKLWLILNIMGLNLHNLDHFGPDWPQNGLFWPRLAQFDPESCCWVCYDLWKLASFWLLLPLDFRLSIALAHLVPQSMQCACCSILSYLTIGGVSGMNVFATWKRVEH